ncbi:MAG: protoporphyrinogen oxidase [Planctomycetota bacterium]
MDAETLVLGGGITGLAAAHRLHRAGRDVLVVERAQRAGGVIDTEEVDGYRLEWGPHSILASASEVFELAEETGAATDLVPADAAALNRYIIRGGRLCRLPSGPLSFLTSSALSAAGKARLLLEPLQRRRRAAEGDPEDDGESVAEFFRRRLGRETQEYLVDPFVTGIYAGLTEELEAASAFPKLVEMERSAGSVFLGAIRHLRQKRRSAPSAGRAPRRRGTWTLAAGMAHLPAGVATALGARVLLGHEVTGLEPAAPGWRVTAAGPEGERSLTAREVLIALPAHRAAPLLAPFEPEGADLLAAIPYAPVALLHVGARADLLPRALDGFGFLVPRSERMPILGSIWSSAIFPGRAPSGRALLSIFAGGRGDPGALELPEDELVERSLRGLWSAIGGEFAPELVRVRPIPRAIPQHTRGHQRRLRRLAELTARHPGLALAGGHIGGVSMGNCIESAWRAASMLLGGTGTPAAPAKPGPTGSRPPGSTAR